VSELIQAPSFGGRRGGGVTESMRAAGRMLLPRAMRRWVRHGQASLLDLVSLGKGLPRTLPGGEVVRVHPTSAGMSWNLTEYEAFRAATVPGATVLDVGANVGAYSLLFAQWVGQSGKVYAFEPSPAMRAGLVRHLRLNGLDHVVDIVPAAVADRCTEMDFTTAPPDGMHRLLTSSSGNGTLRVPVVTLDGFCSERGVRPSIIKIDVEGFELSVLQGARDTLRSIGAGLEVFMEIHPSLWPELGIARSDVADELHRQGLEMEPLATGQPVWTVEGVCLRLRRAP
jgi:FkbM family methyltransferase